MDTIRQTLFVGSLEETFARELQAIHEQKLLKRLWSQDVTLWPAGEAGAEHLRRNLEFLHLPERLPQLLSEPLRADAEAMSQGLTDRILIAFGSVHHFCKGLLNIHPETKNQKCIILDSCHPKAIREAESQADPKKTLIVLVNKSAYGLEDHCLFLYFQKQLQRQPSAFSSKHFVASSELNTFLASTASEYRFRFLHELPPGIVAAYCSVLYLGVLLSVLAGVELEALRAACQEARKVNSEATPTGENPASEIASFLGAVARSGRPFVSFLASPSLAPFAAALSRLVGGRIGRPEQGLFALANTLPCATQPWEAASGFVILRNGAAEEPEVENCVSGLRARGTPFLEMTVTHPLDLLRHTFGWQVATVLAAARMGLDPFEASDPRLARTLAAEILNNLSPTEDTLQRRPRIQEGQIQVFAEARARQEVSQLNLTECLVSFFEKGNAAAYLGLFVFLDPGEVEEGQFVPLREQFSQALKLPVLLAWGPRSLDTFGYLMTGGAPKGLHLVITGDSDFDLKIPGADYSFGQMYRALALSQFETLSSSGLALRMHLSSPASEALSQVQKAISLALRRVNH